MFDKFKYSRIRPGVIFSAVILFVIVRLMLNAFVSLSDPSETRYASICKNMAEHRNFVDPQFIYDGALRNFDGKPPLYFQLGGLCCRAFGATEFAVRLPATASAVLTLLILFYALRRRAGVGEAWAGVVFCLFNWAFFLFSGIVITDMLLVFSVTGALCAYALFCSEKEKKIFSVAVFFFLGVGMMTKGPVALVLSGLPIFIYEVLNRRKFSELLNHAWVLGGIVFLAISVPWFWLMTEKNPGFLEYFFINENFKRFLFHDYGDRYGAGREFFRGVAFVWFLVLNLPLLFVYALPERFIGRVRRFHKSDFKREPLEALGILGILSMVGFWCLTSRVPLAYLLPTIPLTVIVTAIRLGRNDILHQPFACRALGYLMGITGVAATGLLLVQGEWGSSLSPKLMEDVYSAAIRARDSAPGHRTVQFLFSEKTPYSAEFYLGHHAVLNHGDGDADRLLATKTADESFLIVRRKRTPVMLAPRHLLWQNKYWAVFAPVEKTDGKDSK